MADLRQTQKKRVLNFSRPKKKFVQIYKKKYGPNTTFFAAKKLDIALLDSFFHYGDKAVASSSPWAILT